MRLIDLAGRRFGRLMVQARANDPGRHTMWHCLCDCGAARIIRASHLTGHLIQSCGCLSADRARMRNSTHGATKGYKPTPTYVAWKCMHKRCSNPSPREFPNYKGRGISVCQRWSDYENFVADMGEKPPGLTLERVDNDGNYGPGNCVWATPKEQSRNRRVVHKMEWEGRSVAVSAVCEILGVSHKRVARRAWRHQTSQEEELWDVLDAWSIPRNRRTQVAA